MKHILILTVSAALLTGCGIFLQHVPASNPKTAMVAPPTTFDSTAVQTLGAQGQSAAALDTATAADLAAVKVSAPASAQILGSVTVGLGSPAVQGFWLSSNLVSAPQKGTVTTAAGKSLAVDLLPSTTGAQLSFSAYRALGLALTDLPVVQVSNLN